MSRNYDERWRAEMPRGHDMSRNHDERRRHNVGAAYYIPTDERYEDLGRHWANVHYGSSYAHLAERGRHQVNPPYDYYWHSEQSSFATAGIGGSSTEVPVPRNACTTLFIEGFPAECTRREACRILDIFRRFVGFIDLRLVTRDSGHSGSGPVVLCFADFASPARAAVAMDALQGYKFDRDDSNSAHLRIQFAHSVA